MMLKNLMFSLIMLLCGLSLKFSILLLNSQLMKGTLNSFDKNS